MKITLPDKEQSLRENTNFYKSLDAYEHDLLNRRNEFIMYLVGLHESISFLEERLGKVNSVTIDFRKKLIAAQNEVKIIQKKIEDEGINDKLNKLLK